LIAPSCANLFQLAILMKIQDIKDDLFRAECLEDKIGGINRILMDLYKEPVENVAVMFKGAHFYFPAKQIEAQLNIQKTEYTRELQELKAKHNVTE
jgi:hypothetical protein